MPRLVSANLPAWAERAHEIIGHRPGLAVLAALAAHPDPMAHADVARAAGLSPQTASVALRRLEDAGIVTGSIPRPQRPGPGVRWSLEQEALTATLEALTQGLQQSPPPAER